MATPNNKPKAAVGSAAAVLAAAAAAVAVFFGLLASPISRRYPILHWITYLSPSKVGFIPATTPRPWGYTFEQLERTDLRGQTALVTGANSGIGSEIARALSRQGAAVTIACRNPQRCFSAADGIRSEDGYSGAPVSPLLMDVSDLKSVQAAAKRFLQNNERLDMLFLNAGIIDSRPEKGATKPPLSKDGIEKMFATNVVGHHLLYRLLEPALEKSNMATVVSTSSDRGIVWLPPYGFSFRFGDTSPLVPSTLEGLNEVMPMPALYGRSKLAQVAWSKALSRRLGEKSNIYVNSAHPGIVRTSMAIGENAPDFLPKWLTGSKLWDSVSRAAVWTPDEGALTLLYLGVAKDEIRSKDLRGRYFHPQAVEFDHPYAKDEELQENVWKLCESLVESFL